MSKPVNIRWGWLRFMYLYTIVGAGLFGLGIVIKPEMIKAVFRWPAEEPISLGIVGSVYVAFGIVSLFGFRHPLKFAPILLLQLCYKAVWFAGVVAPLLVSGRFPSYGLLTVVIFATYIVGDLIAIPFPYVFAGESAEQSLG